MILSPNHYFLKPILLVSLFTMVKLKLYTKFKSSKLKTNLAKFTMPYICIKDSFLGLLCKFGYFKKILTNGRNIN